jgi:parallel beta-helix repeat protein
MMIKTTRTIFVLTTFVFSLFSFMGSISATNYFVRTDGNNNNTGRSNTTGGAWRSVNDALYGYCNWGAGPTGQGVPMLPGDTLFVNDGVYVENGYTFGLKIANIAGSNTNRFVLKAVNKWAAKLEVASKYNCFNIDNSKGVTIDGFDIYAADTSTNIFSGIMINDPSEFVTVRNCKIHNFGLGGVGGNGGNIIIENNYVYDNSVRNPGNGSGINFYHPKVVSTNRLAGGYGHIIRGNRVYNNYCTQSYTTVGGTFSTPTDGNGIIIDDWNFTQDASGTPFKVPCLIENNVCFKNGGSGIRVYDSDNVTIRNNTCYYNSWVTATYPSGSGDYPSGDIGVSCETGKGNRIVVVNNICISDPSLPASNYGIGLGNKLTNSSVSYNYTNKLFFTAGGTANVLGTNPQFVNATVVPATADFHLVKTSPAINIGLNSNAAATDYDGVARPQAGTVDAGSYEVLNALLPVELLNFSGYTEGGVNYLNWTTASEINNKGFYVETQFIASHTTSNTANAQSTTINEWKTLDFVHSKGKAAAYNFTDVRLDAQLDAINRVSTSYYRLRQIDNDGKETFSKIIAIERKNAMHHVSISPNPASNVLTVASVGQDTNFDIIDVLGQFILRGLLNRPVDVSTLLSGTYIVRVGLEQVMFVKQ